MRKEIKEFIEIFGIRKEQKELIEVDNLIEIQQDEFDVELNEGIFNFKEYKEEEYDWNKELIGNYLIEEIL